MEFRPKLQSTISTADDTIEDVSGGCVMHRYKGYKRKRRWGQLRVEVKNKTARCVIRLYKHDIANVSQDTSKSKEPKLKFEIEFSREDFCGLEKGEHFDRYGMRRYLCIITREKHLIIEDAVMTAAGINHNVLGTWYQLISQVMQYDKQVQRRGCTRVSSLQRTRITNEPLLVNRWKVVECNPKLAMKVCYFHVSSENVSECHSLEDKTRENRNCLVLRSWKLQEISDITEQTTQTGDNEPITDISFRIHDNFGNLETVNITVEGTPTFQQIIQQFKRSNGEARKTTTVCPGFDDLNCHPNLVRIPKQTQPKGIRKMLNKTLSNSKPSQENDMHQTKKQNRHSQGNLYVKLEREESNPPPYYNVLAPTESTPAAENPLASNNYDMDEPSTSRKGAPCLHDSNPRIRVPPSLANYSPTQSFEPEFTRPMPRSMLPSNGWNSGAPPQSPPRLPSVGLDDNDLKKAPGLATQQSFDSDYQTGDMSTLLTENDFPQGRYVNVQRSNSDSESTFNGSLPRRPTTLNSLVYQNLTSEPAEEQPPAIPARDQQAAAPHYLNLVNRTSSQPPTPPSKTPPPRPPKPLSRPPSIDSTNNQVMTRTKDGGERAPPVPGRKAASDEDITRPRVDRVASSILQGTLPPLNSGEEQRPYENSLAFEISINEVLQGNHLNNSGGRWLDLPHSVFVRIALDLEKEGITVGDWKAFAEKLGLTFHHIQQLAGLMRTHPTLRPLEVLLLHWSRTQSPVTFSRANLQEMLIMIGREDLAQIIPPKQ